LRRELLTTWQDNVMYRVGKPFREAPDDDTVNIPADWSRTKNKQAQIFTQCPTINLRARVPGLAAAAPLAAAALNFELQEKIHAEYAMDECAGDGINASGIMISMVKYLAAFGETVDVPVVDTSTIPPGDLEVMIKEKLIETRPYTPTLYECYDIDRISPARFLWPVEFKGSNWQKAPWLGHEGYMPLTDAKRMGWVEEDEEGEAMEVDELLIDDDLELKQLPVGRYVKYIQIFYRAAFFDPQERHPLKIKRMVLVESRTEGDEEVDPVVDEDFQWQEWVEGTAEVEAVLPSPENPQGTPAQPARQGRYIGMTNFPIKVRTLTTVSDLAIPPSDSEMGRPQVKEMIRSRSQMIRQREHSLPIRWFDVNMVDEEIAALLRAGVMQDMIPMNGPGSNAIGEVARANYPRENFEFMRIFNADLDETWAMGANQMGLEAPGDQSATEAKIVQSSGNVKTEYERSKMLAFFLENAKGVFALMQMFSDFEDYVEIIGPNGVRTLKTWNKDSIPGDYVFEAKPDGAVRVDISQKKAEAINVYKLLRRDPLINPSAPITEVLQTHGYDLSQWLVPPPKPKAEKPNIRYSFKGEDMMMAIPLARMQKADDGPLTEQDIEAAKKMIQLALEIMPAVAEAVPGMVQDPTAEANAKADTTHPGPTASVQPLNRRYENAGTPAATGGGS